MNEADLSPQSVETTEKRTKSTMDKGCEDAPVMVDLKTPEYAEQFASSGVYIKKAIVEAKQMTREDIEALAARKEKDVRYDEGSRTFVVETYVMRERTNEEGATERCAELECISTVEPGDWIVTNPHKYDTDHENNYVIPNDMFQRNFRPVDQEGRYRKMKKVRIIKNNTGRPVMVETIWGIMHGDAECYFCVPCSEDDEARFDQTKCYILSSNDFDFYVRV